jgi:hypothetical protein
VQIEGVEVRKPLVYACPNCDSVVATPQITSARVFAAKTEAQGALTLCEVRVPVEAEDLALAVFASLGLAPRGDIFALPVRLGLRLVGHLKLPSSNWRLLDSFRASERARPFLTAEVIERLDGLRRAWSASSRAVVIRWLIVAAYHASLRGFRPEPEFQSSNQHQDTDAWQVSGAQRDAVGLVSLGPGEGGPQEDFEISPESRWIH